VQVFNVIEQKGQVLIKHFLFSCPIATMANSSPKGMVFPPYKPTKRQGNRNTNQLEFMKNVVFKAVWKHPNAWPFHTPVDPIKLGISDYHDVIRTPMDLGTIEKRLKNLYYNDVSECIYDFTTMFVNCYVYNDINDYVVKLAKELEKWFHVKMADMPKEEKELYRKQESSKQQSDGEDEDMDTDDLPSKKTGILTKNVEKKYYTKKTLMILNRLNS